MMACVLTLIKGWPAWGYAAGPLAGAAYYLMAMRKFFRRRRLAAEPFPESWRKVLDRCVPFYRRLEGGGKKRFEDLRLRLFVHPATSIRYFHKHVTSFGKILVEVYVPEVGFVAYHSGRPDGDEVL